MRWICIRRTPNSVFCIDQGSQFLILPLWDYLWLCKLSSIPHKYPFVGVSARSSGVLPIYMRFFPTERTLWSREDRTAYPTCLLILDMSHLIFWNTKWVQRSECRQFYVLEFCVNSKHRKKSGKNKHCDYINILTFRTLHLTRKIGWSVHEKNIYLHQSKR